MTNTTRAAQPVDIAFSQDFARRLIAGWNSHDPARLTELCHSDVLWESPLIVGGHLIGHEALTDWLQTGWRSAPDLTIELNGPLHLAADGLSFMSEWTATGTMTGPLSPPGFAPTNRAISISGVDRHWFSGERLFHVRTTSDAHALARQIGAAPAEGSRAEKLGIAMQRLSARRLRRKV